MATNENGSAATANAGGSVESKVSHMAVITDKKALASWKNNHELHLLLIQRQNGLTKAQALVQAYHEGVEGLSKRL